MKKHYLIITYQETLLKYHKFRNRLTKKINNGTFAQLSGSKKRAITSLVEGLRKRLEGLQPKLAALAAVGLFSMSVGFSDLAAQPFVKIDDPNLFGTPVSNSPVIATGDYLTAAFVDLDNDGDKDAVVSNYSGAYGEGFAYYKNTGTVSAAIFVQQTGVNNPFYALFSPTGYSTANMADMDGDGDLDLMSGGDNDNLYYFQNTGTVSAPAFTPMTGTENFFTGLTFNGINDELFPFPVDIDDDGDFDFFMSDEDMGKVAFYLNTGTATAPVLAQQTGTLNPFDGIDFGYRSRASFADIDNDGDMDAIIVEGYENYKIFYYKNMGTASAANFVEQTGTNSPFNNAIVDEYLSLAFVDLDNDGDLDIFSEGKNSLYYKNTGTASAPVYPGFTTPLNIKLDLGDSATPELVDIDNDGDLDAFIGYQDNATNYGTVAFYKNTGTSSHPVYILQTGTLNPINGVALSGRISLSFADLDGDNDFDVVIGQNNGDLLYYQNTGSIASAVFAIQNGTSSPFSGINPGYNASPAFVDLDNDGDQDVVVGLSNGSILYLVNTNTATAPAFSLQTGTNNPLSSFSLGSNESPTFLDFDEDGDLDLAVGNDNGNIYYLQNAGPATAPVFTLLTGTDSPFDGVTEPYNASPVFADLDNDGDFDILIGTSYGKIYFYQNNATAPEINVLKGATALADGDNTTLPSGAVNATGTPVTFTIQNTGGSPLNISSITVSGNNATEFVVASVPTSIAAGASGTFTVAFAPVGLTGAKDAVINIANNDGDESSYQVNISATATTATAVNIAQANIASSKLYPNPGTDKVTVELELRSVSDVKVILSDLAGKEMLTTTQTTVSAFTTDFSVANLNRGVYTVTYFVNGTAAKSELLMIR